MIVDAIDFQTLDELDRQYDIKAAVPEINDIAKGMLDESDIFRKNCAGYREFSYGAADLKALDYFPSAFNSPLLVYLHGGYWHKFDKAFFSLIGKVWNEVGVSVAAVNYRLAPEVRMGDIVDDVRQSIAWLWRNAEVIGFNRSNMIVCGSSAGGHLTAMMLATDWRLLGTDLPVGMLRGGVSISGLHDLSPFLRAPFLKDILQLTQSDVEEYSPSRLVPFTPAPLITCVGGDESIAFHAQNRLIAKCWPEVFREDVPSVGTNHVTVNKLLTDDKSDLFKAIQKLFL